MDRRSRRIKLSTLLLADDPLYLLSNSHPMVSVKRADELCALSVLSECMTINGDGGIATLRPNLAFIPKNIRSIIPEYHS